MKKPAAILLICITISLVIFTLGFYFGRNICPSPITVSTVSIAAPMPVPTTPDSTAVLVNINTADVTQLTSLPGIGDTLAQRIIDYRNANGPFASVGSLMQVSGIGEKRIEAIWDLVTVEGD